MAKLEKILDGAGDFMFDVCDKSFKVGAISASIGLGYIVYGDIIRDRKWYQMVKIFLWLA